MATASTTGVTPPRWARGGLGAAAAAGTALQAGAPLGLAGGTAGPGSGEAHGLAGAGCAADWGHAPGAGGVAAASGWPQAEAGWLAGAVGAGCAGLGDCVQDAVAALAGAAQGFGAGGAELPGTAPGDGTTGDAVGWGAIGVAGVTAGKAVWVGSSAFTLAFDAGGWIGSGWLVSLVIDIPVVRRSGLATFRWRGSGERGLSASQRLLLRVR
ncbi:MAG: hypothetical protein U0838_06490 [Chloroflexota bacterium]